MSYDFDWVGSTLAVGDDEGGSLTVATEPTGNQQGVDTPGLLAGQFQTWLRGGFNLDLSQGPPDPSQDIDVASSTAGSNFMPGWRFVQSSNTNVTLRQNRDTTVSAGSNLRFSFASGSANDEAYIETLLPVRGAYNDRAADLVEFWTKASSGGVGTAILEAQYLTVDGALTGGATRFSLNVGTTYSQVVAFGGNITRMAPANARLLRLRFIADRQAGTGAFTLDVADGQRYAAQPYGLVTGDFLDPTRSPGVVQQRNGLMWALPDVGNAGLGGVIGLHLVGMPFVTIDIPASSTTELTPSDNALGTLGGSPRLYLPWDCSIVGMAYRMSAAPTAGTINIQATVSGSNVWAPWGALGTGMALADYASQAPGIDTVSAGNGVGVQVVTNGAFTPTTRDLHVTLFVAVEYDGA